MPRPFSQAMDRRSWLWRAGGGLGGIAMSWLAAKERGVHDGLHHPPRAKNVVQFFMSGAASQCDLFDYKPELVKRNGEKWDPGEKVELFQSAPGHVMASPWRFRPHGECGKYVSDLVPHIGSCVDDIAFLHGMTSKSNVHGPATLLQASGFVAPGFPSAGAWISYALGRMTDDLPAFVVLPDSRGYAPCGPKNWSAGFLPAAHQGTMFRPDRRNPIPDLVAPPDAGITEGAEREGLALLGDLNRRHRALRPGDDRLDARMASYELAARLQLSAPEVLDLKGESQPVRDLYGIDDAPTAEFGRNCLLTRRLLERGVRFVQVWSGADNGHPRRNWDSHENLQKNHGELGRSIDRPIAALIKDLKRRGLLDETLILWTTEFGRMPCSQGAKGRDHNPFGFTTWLSGGGIKGGTTHGATDPWSFRATTDPTTVHDVHATILHLLGIDHERLTVRQDGIDRRLTDVHGHVIHPILA